MKPGDWLGLSTKKPGDCQAQRTNPPSMEFSTTTFGLGHNMLVQLGLCTLIRIQVF